MKVLWLIANGGLAHWKIRKEFEQVIGKDNVIFYCKPPPHSWSKPVDPQGMTFYPKTYGLITKDHPTLEAAKEEQADIIMSEGFYGMKDIDIPRAKIMTDIHGVWMANKKWVLTGQVDMILTRCYNGGIGYRIKNELGCAAGFLPLSTSSVLFNNLHLERMNDVYLSGAFNARYPLRFRMIYRILPYYGNRIIRVPRNKQFTVDGIKYFRHGGEANLSQYVHALNTSKILAFSAGVPTFKSSVLKFYEGLACEILVMSDMPYDWKALRFEPSKNMVEVNTQNFLENFWYYLENEDERLKIARNGRKLFLKYHTNEERSKQLIAQFKELINAKNEERLFDSRNVKGEAGRMLRILEEDEENFDRGNLINRCMDRGRSEWQSWSKKVSSLYVEVWKGNLSIEEWEKTIKLLAEGENK